MGFDDAIISSIFRYVKENLPVFPVFSFGTITFGCLDKMRFVIIPLLNLIAETPFMITDYSYSTKFDTMDANKVTISIFTVFLLVSVLGVAYAEIETVNATDNMTINISANETNQSFQNQSLANNTGITNRTDNGVSTGGIKNFMKSFQYQSKV